MNKKKKSRILSAFVIAGIVINGGCAIKPQEPMHYALDEHAAMTVKRSGSGDSAPSDHCSVRIQKIEDSRNFKKTFGTSTDFVLFAEGVPQWVREGLASLSATGCAVSFDQKKMSADAPLLTLNVTIYKAYMHHVATSKNANLVLGVIFERSGKIIDKKIYRGQDTSVNWSTSPSEIESAMNRAMTTILTSLARDVNRLCVD